MLIAGIIPGPHEPNLVMNSFLEPVVKDLSKLWKGVKMQTADSEQTVRAALICGNCDIPASRKLGGFLGQSAFKGRSRYLKTFPTPVFQGPTDFSGFD